MQLWQRTPAADLRIDDPPGELRLWLAIAVLHLLASTATGFAIRASDDAAGFTHHPLYVGFKIGLFLLLPVAVLWRQGYGWRDLVPQTPRGPGSGSWKELGE